MFIIIKLKNIIFSAMCILIACCIPMVLASTDDKDAVSVPILMYHSILKNNSSSPKYVVTPAQLEEDLKYIKENGYTTITINDLIEYVYNDKALPQKPIILSFDDGYYNNYYYAYPLMKKYDCKMVISVVGKFTDTFSNSDDSNPNYSHLTWTQIDELIKSDYVEIQNHTYNMHSMSATRSGCKKNKGESIEAYKKVITDDIMSLQNSLKEHTGYTPQAFTYPFGAVSNASFDIIKEMGFKASLSCREGINEITKDKECLYMLKRFIRPSGLSSKDFFERKIN